jgi:phospholipid/cholesterol/gamma-HCH transport system substrate-binding protein
MITLAFVAVLWLARAQLTTQYAHYDIYFRGAVSGLRDGSLVEYSGVPVGKVSDVRIDPNNVEQIRVTIEIDSSTLIKEDARASVETNILSGVSYIQIVGGTKDAATLVAKEGERYPVIKPRFSRLASVVARAPQLIEKADEALNRLNELLDDKNRAAITASLDNIRVFTKVLADRNQDIADLTQNAKKAAAALSDLIDTVDKSYSGPDGLGNRAATALADFDRLAKNLNDTGRLLQSTVQDVRPGLRTFSQQTLGDVGTLVGEARQLVSGLNRLTTQISRNPSQVLFGDRREGYRP